MKKIRMGMIGGGLGAFIGDAHRRASRICNDFELVCGVFDANYERSREFASIEGIDLSRCYESVDAMIAAELKLPADKRMQFFLQLHGGILRKQCAGLFHPTILQVNQSRHDRSPGLFPGTRQAPFIDQHIRPFFFHFRHERIPK